MFLKSEFKIENNPFDKSLFYRSEEHAAKIKQNCSNCIYQFSCNSMFLEEAAIYMFVICVNVHRMSFYIKLSGLPIEYTEINTFRERYSEHNKKLISYAFVNILVGNKFLIITDEFEGEVRFGFENRLGSFSVSAKDVPYFHRLYNSRSLNFSI